VLARYEPTIRRLAKRYRPRGAIASVLDLDDLIAVGRMAVFEALERYESYGISEATFVRTRIKQRMVDVIRKVDTRTRAENRLLRAYAEGEDDVDERRARKLAARHTLSLDQTFGDYDPMIERLESDAPDTETLAADKLRHDQLAEAIDELPERQREAVTLCLERGLRYREIGELMGISESRVHQLQKAAIRRLSPRFSDAA